MDTQVFHDLKKMLCKEADEIAKRQDMTPTALDNLHKITGSIKNIDKILMADKYAGEGSYHDYGGSYNGSYDGGYDRGNSERRYRDSDGRYSSRGYGRSYGDAKETMMAQLSDIMMMANDGRSKDIIRRAKEELERM